MQEDWEGEAGDRNGTTGQRHEDSAYTRQYFTLARAGHVRWTQEFGVPCLVWNVAVWPSRRHLQRLQNQAGSARDLERAYREIRRLFVVEINELLRKLQRRGRVGGAGPRFNVGSGEYGPVVPTESVAFTMWWGDRGETESLETPPAEDLRIRVQAEINPDFASISFIIDASKAWGVPPYALDEHVPQGLADEGADESVVAQSSEVVPGQRRRRIFHAARLARRISSERLAADPTGTLDIVPETGVTERAARSLLWSGRTLYQDIWEEFSEYFECRLTDIAGDSGEIFGNFRGVVLSTPGAPTGESSHVSRFVHTRGGRSSLDAPYPNAVVRSYWPFLRRTRSEADYRDWIACGVFDWRALYITALGGRSSFDPGDEARSGALNRNVPAGFLPSPVEGMAGTVGNQTHSRTSAASPQGDRPDAFRYLVLTSGEPSRRELGRMVDTLNVLETVRLSAVRSFESIREADVYLGFHGQLLDQIASRIGMETEAVLLQWARAAYADAYDGLRELLQDGDELKALPNSARLFEAWHACRAAVEAERQRIGSGNDVSLHPLLLYRRLLDDIAEAAADIPGVTGIEAKCRTRLRSTRKAFILLEGDLTEINREAERKLLGLQHRLDAIGRGSGMGLAVGISRAGHYADRFRSMVPLLRVGAIETWLDYARFAASGVQPQLQFIENVGKRLEYEQTRLRETIGVVQSQIARGNTNQLVAISEATGAGTKQLVAISEATGVGTERLVMAMKEIQVLASRVEKLQKRFGTANWIYTILLIFGLLLGFGWALHALLTIGACGVELDLGIIRIMRRC